MIKRIILGLVTLAQCAFIMPFSGIQEIHDFYKKPLLLVDSLRLDHVHNDYNAMISLCYYFDQPMPKLIKQLCVSIQQVQKFIKKNGKQKQLLLIELQGLRDFMKKHKRIYEAILIHKNIKDNFQQLFYMIDHNQDVITYIDQHRELFGLQEAGDMYLKVMLKNIRKFGRQISKIEDYVHSDYIDLKMQNYVFKIELIKLRNVILFDKRYKY